MFFITKCSDPLDFNIDRCSIEVSKHFRNTWMKKWIWDYPDLRNAIKNAYRTDRVGNHKYEAYYAEKSKSKKIIFVVYQEPEQILVITGAEGSET